MTPVSIHEVLVHLRHRATMYLSRPTVDHLRTFIGGWTIGNQADDDIRTFESDFQAWIQRRFEVVSNHDWASIITFYTMDKSRELEHFFELYDEFMAEQKR